MVYEDRELTYGELNRRANRLAHHLRELGVGPDVRVGIRVERGPELVVAVLGVLKAGGAYLPLDPGYPRERLLEMVQDSAPVVVLTHGALAARVAGLELSLLALDEDASWSRGRQPATDRPRSTPDVLPLMSDTTVPQGWSIASALSMTCRSMHRTPPYRLISSSTGSEALTRSNTSVG